MVEFEKPVEYGVFQNGKPVATFYSKTVAEEHALYVRQIRPDTSVSVHEIDVNNGFVCIKNPNKPAINGF